MQHAVDHRGCSLAYARRGSGAPVLFVQGCGVQGDGWLPQIDELSGRFECAWFDNRGIGKSQPMGSPLTVAQMAEDAVRVMDALGWARAHWVGHSLGGLIAIQAALNDPNRIMSLSLLCTISGGRYCAPLTSRMMWLGLRTQIGTRAMRRRGFLALVTDPQSRARDPEKLADRMGQLFGHDLADQPTIVKHQLRALRACDLTGRLPELKSIPSLVVSATHDPIAPPSAGRVLAEGIGAARLVEFPDASHALPITHARQVNSLLLEHLEHAEPARE